MATASETHLMAIEVLLVQIAAQLEASSPGSVSDVSFSAEAGASAKTRAEVDDVNDHLRRILQMVRAHPAARRKRLFARRNRPGLAGKAHR